MPNYAEPFFGSGAVLLGRESEPGTETVNDLDCMLANFYRALQHAPEEVAFHADNPVNEADQHARHLWLCSQVEFRERMKTEPDFYDTKIAGWWVWGQCIWIGSGWCSVQLPSRQLPHLGDAGRGIHRQRPHLGPGSHGTTKSPNDRRIGGIYDYMQVLSARFRRVRVCCGDWSRILGPSVTFKHGLTGVFLDPPYSDEAGRDPNIYAEESGTVAHDVREWAIANGDNPLLRICVAGYEGEHQFPADWECVAWKPGGGYDGQNKDRDNHNNKRERLWFSPHCRKPHSLF